ncbi:hypothetical protein V8E54_014419 [Elaphomyces granulatus]
MSSTYNAVLLSFDFKKNPDPYFYPQILMSSDQRLFCSRCAKPWQSTHYKTCDDCRRKQRARARDIQQAVTDRNANGPDSAGRPRPILPRPTPFVTQGRFQVSTVQGHISAPVTTQSDLLQQRKRRRTQTECPGVREARSGRATVRPILPRPTSFVTQAETVEGHISPPVTAQSDLSQQGTRRRTQTECPGEEEDRTRREMSPRNSSQRIFWRMPYGQRLGYQRMCSGPRGNSPRR